MWLLKVTNIVFCSILFHLFGGFTEKREQEGTKNDTPIISIELVQQIELEMDPFVL